jgi:hypothetical protein
MPWNDVKSTGFPVSDRQFGSAFVNGSLELGTPKPRITAQPSILGKVLAVVILTTT